GRGQQRPQPRRCASDVRGEGEDHPYAAGPARGLLVDPVVDLQRTSHRIDHGQRLRDSHLLLGRSQPLRTGAERGCGPPQSSPPVRTGAMAARPSGHPAVPARSMTGVTAEHTFRSAGFTAHLFDLDGVITPTAEVHMRAWARMFEEFLASRGVSEPYTDADYFAHVDGRPRYDGVRALLASRGITVPEGEDSDPADQPLGQETVRGLGNRKNAQVLALLRAEGVEPYPGTVAFLDALPAGPSSPPPATPRRCCAPPACWTASSTSWTATSPPGRACRASPPRTPSSTRRSCWASSPPGRRSTRMRSPGSGPEPPGASAP